MVGLPAKVERDSTIYVVSHVPINDCDEILQAITATKHSFHDSKTMPWRAENRYYSANLHFELLESVENLQKLAPEEDDLPALIFVVDAAKAVDIPMLSSVEAQAIDVPLVVGHGSSGNYDSSERNREVCLEHGFEYIDLERRDEGNPDIRDQSGIERLAEALQAHMWPNAQMKPKGLPQAYQSAEDQSLARSTVSQHSGFDNDFSPFVSSSSSRSLPEDEAIFELEDAERDPTSQFSALFSSLSALREQAQDILDDDSRKDFAADVALRFARQLDALMGTEADDLPEDVARLTVSDSTQASQ